MENSFSVFCMSCFCSLENAPPKRNFSQSAILLNTVLEFPFSATSLKPVTKAKPASNPADLANNHSISSRLVSEVILNHPNIPGM